LRDDGWLIELLFILVSQSAWLALFERKSTAIRKSISLFDGHALHLVDMQMILPQLFVFLDCAVP